MNLEITFRNRRACNIFVDHIYGTYMKESISYPASFLQHGVFSIFFSKNRSSLKLPVRQTDLFGAFVLRSQGTCMVRYRDNQRKREFFGVLRDSFVYNLPHIFRKERKSSDGLLPSHFSISTSVNKLYLVLHLTVITDLLLTL